MDGFETVIRGGTVVTTLDSTQCDVGIRHGRITALALDLPAADHEIEARGGGSASCRAVSRGTATSSRSPRSAMS